MEVTDIITDTKSSCIGIMCTINHKRINNSDINEENERDVMISLKSLLCVIIKLNYNINQVKLSMNLIL